MSYRPLPPFLTIKQSEIEGIGLFAIKDIPKEMKTKGGYLKDGFVVDTNSEEDIVSVSDEEDFEGDSSKESDDETGSELEEEEYEYTDED